MIMIDKNEGWWQVMMGGGSRGMRYRQDIGIMEMFVVVVRVVAWSFKTAQLGAACHVGWSENLTDPYSMAAFVEVKPCAFLRRLATQTIFL